MAVKSNYVMQYTFFNFDKNHLKTYLTTKKHSKMTKKSEIFGAENELEFGLPSSCSTLRT